jgi:hypothetical protein
MQISEQNKTRKTRYLHYQTIVKFIYWVSFLNKYQNQIKKYEDEIMQNMNQTNETLTEKVKTVNILSGQYKLDIMCEAAKIRAPVNSLEDEGLKMSYGKEYFSALYETAKKLHCLSTKAENLESITSNYETAIAVAECRLKELKPYEAELESGKFPALNSLVNLVKDYIKSYQKENRESQ